MLQTLPLPMPNPELRHDAPRHIMAPLLIGQRFPLTVGAMQPIKQVVESSKDFVDMAPKGFPAA